MTKQFLCVVLLVLLGVWTSLGVGQDTCETAPEVFLDTPTDGTISFSHPNIFTEVSFCGTPNTGEAGDQVYRFVAPSSGTFLATTCGTSPDFLDSKLSIYTGTCDTPVCVTGNDDYCGFLSGSEFEAVAAGQEFFLLVHSYTDSTGVFTLLVTEVASDDPNPCTDGAPLFVGLNTYNQTAYPSTLLGDLGFCGALTRTGNGIVTYTFTAPSTGRYQIASLEDGYVTVYRGGCDNAVCADGPTCTEADEVYCYVYDRAAVFEANLGEDFLVVAHFLTKDTPPVMEVLMFELDTTECLAPTVISSENLPITLPAGGGENSGFISCGGVHEGGASDSFFRFVSPSDGSFAATTCGSSPDFETRISIYTGCNGEENECWVGNQGWCDTHSFIEFPTKAGEEYIIMVHSYPTGSSVMGVDMAVDVVVDVVDGPGIEAPLRSVVGDFTLDVYLTEGCELAPTLEVDTTIYGSSFTDAYQSSFPNCGNFNYDGYDNLYKFIPEVKGFYNVRTCSNFPDDTQISVYRGTCHDFSCVGGNDDFCGYRSSLDFIAEAGEPFLVMVHGYFGDQVQFNLTTELLLTAQDSCADAYSISVGETVRGDIGIGFVSGFPTCDDVENDPYSSDVFYRFVAPAPGVYEIETCSDTFIYPADTKISVYSGSCDDPVCVVANDDAGGNCGLGSLVNINAVEEGEQFIIMVHAFRRHGGAFELSVREGVDLCSIAREITLGPFIVGNTETQGVPNTLPDCGVSNDPLFPDVLFRFIAPESKRYTVSTCSLQTPTDTKISIYAFCGDYCLNGNDDACPTFKSRASFIAGAGTEYLISVEPYSSEDSGEFSIEIFEDEQELNLGETQEPQETGPRPQLLDSSLHIREAKVMNHRFEYAQAILDFDQKLYLNEALMCPFAELSCEDEYVAECSECDWDAVSPGCWGANCCSERCAEEDEGFIPVPLNSQSELIILNTSESQYFRFVMDNISACAPVQISVEAEYGNAQLLVSNVAAFPEWESRESFGNVFSDPTFHYSQASVILCPNPFFAQGYEHVPGVYSVGVFALENTAFRLSISVGTHHPIPQPAEKLSCDDVPEIEFEVARGREGSIHDVLCLEDSITKVVHLDYPIVDLSNQVLIPITPGCHVTTFVASGLALERNEFEPADVYCFSSIDDEIVELNTSVIGRRKSGYDLDAVTFTTCSDEPIYVHCSYRFWKAEYYTLLFSTTAVPKRTALSDIRPGPLAMSSGLGAVASTLQGETNEPCVDWQKNCNQFVTTSISDPQPFWPPSGDTWIVSGHFDSPYPPDRLVELGLASMMENRVTFIRYLSKANNNLLTSESLLDLGSISIIALTNENGDPVLLPNDGKKNKKRQDGASPQSYLDFVPNIAYSSLNKEFFPPCDLEKYEKHQKYIDRRVSDLLAGNTFEDVIPGQYNVEVLQQAYARLSCVATAAEFLETETSMTILRGQTGCKYPVDSAEWAEDPCCNPAAVPVSCCAPYVDTVEDTVYTEANPDKLESCSSYECAESYLNDLADTLNTFTDPVIGCASGILRPEEEKREVIEMQINKVLRACAEETELGDLYRGGFTGVKCAEDNDCSSGVCNRYLGVCHLPDSDVVEEKMLRCYISKISSLTEDYLRENVLSADLEKLSRDSPEFFEAVKAAATRMDCVNTENALDFSQMTHKKVEVPALCALGYVSQLSPYLDLDLIPKLCPTQYCLGDFCQYNTQGCYHQECAQSSEFASSEETCEAANNATYYCGVDFEDCNGTSSCVYCPDNGGQCEAVGGYSQEECNDLFMCVLHNGTKYVTNNQEECESQKECSVDCVGAQCRGKAPGRGVCLVSPPEGISFTDCILAGGINTGIAGESDPICLLQDISNPDDCLIDGSARVWETCETLDVDSCTYENFSPGQVFLGCGVDLFRTCENEEECLDSGRCSDLDAYRLISSGSFEASNPVPEKETRAVSERAVKRQNKGDGFQNGACLTSGTHLVGSVSADRIPYCAFGDETYSGCIEDAKEEECDGYIEYFGSFGRWRTWVTPALNKEECLAESFGHSGCQLSNSDSFHQWAWNESACDCRLGDYANTWTWTPGKWVGGQARPLQWKEALPRPDPVYEYRETLDYWTLADWVANSAVKQFTDSVKSQVICESNLITSSLETILCDCVSEDEEESCYSRSTRSIEVGIRDVCAGEVSVLKGPSNSITFDESSVKSRCTVVQLGMLRKSAFAVSRESASVSFQFEEPRKPGVVLNKKGATVGELFGDGAVLEFEKPKLVKDFKACLRVTVDDKTPKVRDFGYTTGSVIYPLGLDIEVVEESFLEFWCATVKRKDVPTAKRDAIQIFPISRIEDYEDEEDQSYSDSTIALVYTLGALYCFDLFLLVFFLVHLAFSQVKRQRNSVPVVAWIGMILIILCIFRIVFCFLWPDDGFGDNSLAEYVVFEIPTFLLFSIVILAISFFRRLSRTKTFFVRETEKSLIIGTIVAVFLVWCLFAVVAIVYSEVILEDNEATSECPGRVEATSNIEEETRTLSIVYQSIVISVTLLLAIIFFYTSYNLFKLTSDKSRGASEFVFRLGAVLVTAFIIRCILFLILLAADFTSAPYLFCTLFITEVLMIFVIQFEFNKHFYRSVASTAATFSASKGSKSKGTASTVISGGSHTGTSTVE